MHHHPSTTAAAKSPTSFDEPPASPIGFFALCVLGAVMLSGATFVAKGATVMRAPTSFDSAGKIILLSVQAAGVQIYECRAGDGGRLTWKFREPLATLMLNGETIGRHFAGPSWQFNDGGEVSGKVLAQKNGSSDRDIPLLQLAVVSDEQRGAVAHVTSIERIDTQGGSFTGECLQEGALHLEPYRAQYVFLRD